MSQVFLRIVNMSISASWIVLCVLLLRMLFKRAPKWIAVLLWGIVAVRLICPFSVESVLSLLPSAETISPEIMEAKAPAIDSGVSIIDEAVNPMIGTSFAPDPVTSANPLQIWIPAFSVVWIVGVIGMLCYVWVSYLGVKRNVSTAVLLRDNVYQSERVVSPFVLGLVKPKIYLPFSLSEEEAGYVISHEKAHLRRKDHLWKPLGFLILALHWFNPLIWLAYALLCRDIELACDEKVIKEMSPGQKADYSQALLTCSVNRRMITACPLAFGEVGVKARVRSVLNYKKPAFWIIAAAILACAAAALCFLTDPLTKPDDELSVFIDMEIAGHNMSGDDAEGIFSAVHHKVLGIDRSLDRTTVYLWAMYQEYSCENGVIVERGGARSPVAITAKRTGKHGHYDLVEYWQPRDGSYYEEDIREKFPWYLHSKALDSQRYVDEQKEFCRKAAEECFADVISQVGGADAPIKVTEYLNGNPFFYGKVLAIYDGQVLVEATKDSEMIRKGRTYYVSTRVKDGGIPLPEIKVGRGLAIVFNGEIAETYPSQINTVYAIYLASDFEGALSQSEKLDAEALAALREPPAMVVVSNEQSIEGQRGTSEWTYRDEKGDSVAVASDGVHPLTAKKTMPRIDILPSYLSYSDPLDAYLGFNAEGRDPIVQVSADKVTIFCWKEEEWGTGNTPGEEISLNEINGTLFFDLKDGNYVYEVTATWKKNEGYGGTASYTFYTRKSGFNPSSAYPKIGEESKVSETFLQTETEVIRETYDKGEYVITKTYH
ncbi:MAG: hypothetical protein IJC26_08955, partial [Clostridia bacterium]|nr:hypothetical protein [Clostridia bacterium]